MNQQNYSYNQITDWPFTQKKIKNKSIKALFYMMVFLLLALFFIPAKAEAHRATFRGKPEKSHSKPPPRSLKHHR